MRFALATSDSQKENAPLERGVKEIMQDHSSRGGSLSELAPLMRALNPIISRVRCDVTAVKNVDGTVSWTRAPLTDDLVRQHLSFGPARGVSQIKAGTSETRIAVLDFDSHHGETDWPAMIEAAGKVAAELESVGLRVIAFRSGGGRGIHLYVLWDEPQDAYSVRQALFAALRRAGYSSGDGGVSRGQVECFPKQPSVPKGGFGNQVFLPLAGKSEPIDLLFGIALGRDAVLTMDWPISDPVPKCLAPEVKASAPGDTSIATLRSALAQIVNDGSDASPDYDEWRNIIFSIHEGTGGSEEGLELAVEFSARNPAVHDERFLRERVWPYAKAREGGVTHLSILAKARATGWRQPHELDFTDEGAPPTLTEEEAKSYGQGDTQTAMDEYAAQRQATKAIHKAKQPEADDGEMSDVRISRILADHFSGRLLYEHGGRGWLVYRCGAYRQCSLGEQLEEAKQLGGRILDHATRQVATLDSTKAAQAMALAKRAMSSAGITAALALAQSDPRIAAKPDQFDTAHDLLNTPNGIVHLPSGELRPHDPKERNSRQCTVDYLPHAPCRVWLRVLREVSNDDADWIDYLHRMLGYILSGFVNEEKLFFWLGVGANGKSLLANVVRRIMGSYAFSVSANFLLVSKREGEAATPTLAIIAGARLVLANEVEAGSRLSGQIVKVATSTEAIGARHNYGAPFFYVPAHKIVVRANHKPIIFDTDEGIWRRIDLLPFDRNFAPRERDTGLEEKLMAEAPGILAWMVRGFREYQARGLHPARRVAAASNDYRTESDLMGQWIEDQAEIGDANACVQSFAYSSYRDWCFDQGLKPTAKKSFTRSLVERGIGTKQEGHGARERLYLGISLRHAEFPAAQDAQD